MRYGQIASHLCPPPRGGGASAGITYNTCRGIASVSRRGRDGRRIRVICVQGVFRFSTPDTDTVSKSCRPHSSSAPGEGMGAAFVLPYLVSRLLSPPTAYVSMGNARYSWPTSMASTVPEVMSVSFSRKGAVWFSGNRSSNSTSAPKSVWRMMPP